MDLSWRSYGNRTTFSPPRKCPTETINAPTTTGCPGGGTCSAPASFLAHGYCVQAFHDLVDEDRDAGKLDENRKAAWCYMALGD